MFTPKVTESKRLSPHASTGVRRAPALPLAIVR